MHKKYRENVQSSEVKKHEVKVIDLSGLLPTLERGASTRAKTLGWWKRCRGSSVQPAFTALRSGLICRFGAGHLAFRLAEAFPPRLLPHPLGLTVSTLSGDLYPRDYPNIEVKAQYLNLP